jgi:hypothetical protein
MNSLLASTAILVIFTILSAGSYYPGNVFIMFNMLTAWRFFVQLPLAPPLLDFCWCWPVQKLTHYDMLQVGIGIGGEYPAGSVGCAESTGNLKSGTRNTWFILFTNTMIN